MRGPVQTSIDALAFIAALVLLLLLLPLLLLFSPGLLLPISFPGLVQAYNALQQMVAVSHTQIYLPSGVSAYTVNVTVGLKWWTDIDSDISYRLEHLKAASMKLSGGWYGSEGIKVYTGCDVSITPDTIQLSGNTTATIQVG